ncbi:MAG: ABC transporter permease, partial [Bacteroidota bacterium]
MIKNIFTIFKKEMLDTLRDKRTIITMVLVPVLVFPIIFILSSRLQQSVVEREQVRSLTVGFVSSEAGNSLEEFLRSQEQVELMLLSNQAELEQLVRSDSILYGIQVQEGFDAALQQYQVTGVNLYFSGTRITGKDRIDNLLKEFEDQVINQRLETMELPQTFIK